MGVVVSLHPKNVGRVFNSPFTNPFSLGTSGIRNVTFCFAANSFARTYVVANAVPFGQLHCVSAELSKAIIASTFRSGMRRGSSGMFWLVKPASNRVMFSNPDIYTHPPHIKLRCTRYWMSFSPDSLARSSLQMDWAPTQRHYRPR